MTTRTPPLAFYRDALGSTPAPSQRQAAEAGRDAVAGRPLRRRTNPGQEDLESHGVAAAGAVTDSGPAMALATDATVVNGEVIDRAAGANGTAR